MNQGEQVTWKRVSSKGYGYVSLIKATIVKINPKTVRISVTCNDGSKKELNVKPENIIYPSKDIQPPEPNK